MSIQPYLVASSEVGLEKDMEPWLLPDTAFPVLEDAYVWSKRVKRRRGNLYLGRLVTESVQSFTGQAGATFTGTLSNIVIEPLSISMTITTYIITDNGAGTLTSSPAGLTGTINYTTGTFSFTNVA